MLIGEIATQAGTTTKTLRFYEEQGLMPAPERTPSGYRVYPQGAIARVDFIHRGKAAGFTLAQIRKILEIRDRGEAPCEHVRDLLDSRVSELDRQIDQLVSMRETIAELRDQSAIPEPETCRSDQVCRYL